MRGKFGSPNPHLEMMQFNLNSIKVSKSSKSIEPEPTTNQTKSIGWDTIVNLPSYIKTRKKLSMYFFVDLMIW